jgi:predicted dehydrogenase
MGEKRAAALGDHRLAAVADADAGRAAALAAKHPGAAVLGSWQELAASPAVDAVLVCTPHDLLAPVARAAVKAGKHVLLEKPGARSAAELAPLRDEAARAGVAVQVGFNHRFHPALAKAKELAEAGALGELMFVRAVYGHGGRLGYEGEWRADKRVSGGGELLDQGVHLIDLARWFLGDFADARGALPTSFWPMAVEDNAFLHLTAAGGRTAWLHASWTEWKNTFSFEVYGKTGKAHVTGLGGSYGPERLVHYAMKPTMAPPESFAYDFPGADGSWEREFAEFAAAARGGTSAGAGLADALAALTVVDRLYQGARL